MFVHKYSASCVVEILENVKPKNTESLDMRDSEGLESGYEGENG